MQQDKLQAITIPFAEGGTTLRIGEEATTEAVGEENPTGTTGEGPSPAISDLSTLGGPFGAY
jgi:hypothetical protein